MGRSGSYRCTSAGGTVNPPGQIIIFTADPTTTTVELDWVRGPGGPVEGYILKRNDVVIADESVLDFDATTYTDTGLNSSTTYVYSLEAIGPGGESEAIITVSTDAVTAPPSGVSFGTEAHAGDDNTATITVTKPASTAAGDFLVAVYSQVDGSISSISAPSGWTEYTALAIGTAPGVAHERTFYKLAGSSEPASYVFGQDASASSTVISILRIPGATRIVASATNVGTASTTITSPAITSPVAAGLLVRVFSYLPNPASAARTVTSAFGVERVDFQTPGSFTGHAIYTAAVAAVGNIAAATATVSAATLLTNATAFIVAASGGEPSVTGITASVTNTTATTEDLNVTAVAGSYDNLTVDVVGDTESSFVDTDGVFAKTITRETADKNVYVDILPALSGTQAPGYTRFGPYVITGTGSALPSRTDQVGPAVISNSGALSGGWVNSGGRPLLQDKRIYGVDWHEGALEIAVQQNDGVKTLSTCGLIRNVEIDCATEGAEGIFGSFLDIQDLDIKNSGGSAPISGTTNPQNGHYFYVRGGRWRRVTCYDAATNRSGTYSWHIRSGSNEITFEAYDMVDFTDLNAMIGGAPIRNCIWDGGEKLGGGQFIIGGLSGGTHYSMEVRNMDFNILVLRGNWQGPGGLVFVNCTYRSMPTNQAIGLVQGIDSPGGLVQVP